MQNRRLGAASDTHSQRVGAAATRTVNNRPLTKIAKCTFNKHKSHKTLDLIKPNLSVCIRMPDTKGICHQHGNGVV